MTSTIIRTGCAQTVRGSVLVLLLLGLAACGPRTEPVAEPPPVEEEPADAGEVARIGDRVIRVEDLQAEAARRRAVGRPVGSAEDLLQELLYLEAARLQAEKQGLAQDPKVREELDRVLVRALRRRELEGAQELVNVTDEEVKTAYEARIATYTRPAMVRLAMLFLAADHSASDARRAELRGRLAAARDQILTTLSSDDSPAKEHAFGPLSITASDDQASRYRGGDLGWFSQGKPSPRLPASVLEAGRALNAHAVSDVLETDTGFYLVMKTDQRPSTCIPLEEVANPLRRTLLAEKQASLEKQFYETCLALAEPEIDTARLAGITLETGPGAPNREDAPPTLVVVRPDR